jgi:hypothetical protein
LDPFPFPSSPWHELQYPNYCRGFTGPPGGYSLTCRPISRTRTARIRITCTAASWSSLSCGRSRPKGRPSAARLTRHRSPVAACRRICSSEKSRVRAGARRSLFLVSLLVGLLAAKDGATRNGAEDTRRVGSPKEPRLKAVMGRAFVLSCAVLVVLLSAVSASAFNIQTSTQNICECLCTRVNCMFGAEVIPVSAACPSGTFVTGGGYRWETEPNLSKVQDSFPDAAGSAWTAIVKSPYESPCNERHCRNLTVYALCAPGELQQPHPK